MPKKKKVKTDFSITDMIKRLTRRKKRLIGIESGLFKPRKPIDIPKPFKPKKP